MAVEHRGNVIVALQHLAGDLRVAGLIGAYEAQTRASKDGHQPVKEKKDRDRKQRGCFQGGAGMPEALPESARAKPRDRTKSRARSCACVSRVHVPSSVAIDGGAVPFVQV